ncbi:MAG: hypothetical protein LQ343_000857 [Gyalolechia ehrenbergii]|nr:MAG: hypothetical protein LQ343_000857 [Gyalolechia ehrenbergii]
MARNELDEILEKYDCIADIPAAIFARDLVAAYPEAKVVLTIRDEQSWYDSMVETVANPRYETAYYRLPRYFDAQLARFSRFCDRYSNMLWHNDFPRYGKQLFRDHNDMVRQLVAKDNLLEFQASQGWEPLCKFLDKKVPEGPYPRTHNWRIYQQEDDAYMQMLYKGTFKKVALALSPVALGFGAWWLGFLRFEV